MMIIIGIGFIGYSANDALQARRASRWPAVTGQVESLNISTVREGSSRRQRSKWERLQYTYEVNGVRYSGSARNREIPGREGLFMRDSISDLRARYKPSAPLSVRYNPVNPAQSRLSASAAFPGMYGVGFGLLLVGTVVFRHLRGD